MTQGTSRLVVFPVGICIVSGVYFKFGPSLPCASVPHKILQTRPLASSANFRVAC